MGRESLLLLHPVFSGSVRNTENTSPVCPEKFGDTMCLHLSVSAVSEAVNERLRLCQKTAGQAEQREPHDQRGRFCHWRCTVDVMGSQR